MRELLVFPSEVEHRGTCELVEENFPSAEFCEVKLSSMDADILIAMRILSLPPAPFIRWVLETTESGTLVLPYCYNLSIALLEQPMPRWLVREICSD